jgi:hypothetical protein
MQALSQLSYTPYFEARRTRQARQFPSLGL